MHHIKAIPLVALFGVVISALVAIFFFSKSPSLFTPINIQATPTPTISVQPTKSTLPNPPSGCVYQQIECVTTPCDPVLICTSPEPEPTQVSMQGCQVAGCSSQLCVDASTSSSLVTTCEYKDSYACYKTATCTRQADGKCGWTLTPQLTSCLASPPPLF